MGAPVALGREHAVVPSEDAGAHLLAPPLGHGPKAAQIHGEHAQVGAGPEAALAIGEHGVEAVREQPVLGGEQAPALLPSAQQPGRGAHPEGALLVLVDGVDQAEGAGHTHPRVDPREASALPADQASAPGAHPQDALAIHPQGPHVVVGEALGGGEGLDVLAHQAVQPGVGGDPQDALVILDQREDLVGAQPLGCGPAGPGLSVEGPEPIAIGTKPQGAVRGFGGREDGLPCQVAVPGVVQEGPVLVEVEPDLGADPQSAQGVLQESPHVVVGEPVPGGQRHEEGVAEPVEAATKGAHPQAALAILQDGGDSVVGQALCAAEDLEALPLEAEQAVGVGAHPEVALVVPAQGPGRPAPGGRVEVVGAHLPSLPAQQALSVGGHPEDPVGIVQQIVDLVAHEPIYLHQAPALHLEDPHLGAHPHLVPVHQQGAHVQLGVGDHLHLFPVHPSHAPIGAHPQGAALAGQGLDHVRGQALLGAQVPGASAVQEHHPPPSGAHPHATARVLHEGLGGVHPHEGVGALVKDLEAHPVEAGHALLGGDPQVAAAALGQILDRDLGQPVLGEPHIVLVASERLVGLKGVGRR